MADRAVRKIARQTASRDAMGSQAAHPDVF